MSEMKYQKLKEINGKSNYTNSGFPNIANTVHKSFMSLV